MNCPFNTTGLAVATILSILLQQCSAQEPIKSDGAATAELSQTANFIRMTESADGKPSTLDTAVISYRGGPLDTQVDLIGAVHIGEGTYYDALNQLFDEYDVLLYELVAPEGTVLPKNAKQSSDNPISFLQNATKNFLGLESQLEKIDYTKTHFIRADMTPEQIAEKMESRGENMMTLALSALLDAMRQQNRAGGDSKSAKMAASDGDLMEMFQSPQKAKLMMARQIVGTENLDLALGGSLNQLLVVDRNAAALKVLKEQIALGHKRIGIFYGAAHLPDLEQHLIGDFQLKKTETRWIKAWDLTTSDAPSRPLDPISVMMNLLKEIK